MNANIDHVKVAIVGAGPAGVGAAVALAKHGIGPVALIEREPRIGGMPARYTSDDIPTYIMWTSGRVIPGHRYAQKLERDLGKTGTHVHLESMVTALDASSNALTIVSPGRGEWRLSADVVLLACGARESSRAERGWIYGHRPAGVFHTPNMLDLAASAVVSSSNAAVIGSEVMGYAAAAKLAKEGANRVALADNSSRPRSFFGKRLFFYCWMRPRWMGNIESLSIRGFTNVESIHLPSGESMNAHKVAITGQLVPNSELLAESGLPVDNLTRRMRSVSDYRLRDTRIFFAGNILGLSCSGQWAYFTGKWAAGKIAAALHLE